MNGKEYVLNALKRIPVERPVWVPYVGCHGGSLIGVSAEDYLKSGELIYNGLREAYKLYKPDGLPLIFDLQIEAEVLGCELIWFPDSPPTVISHPLESKPHLDINLLGEFNINKGRYRELKKATNLVKKDFGSTIALYGLVCGPFTLSLHLRGSQIFLDMYDNPIQTKKLIDYCKEVVIKSAHFYIENGVDVVAIVDPMTSQISPEHFTYFVAPFLNSVFKFVHMRGKPASLFVCGDASRNLTEMFKTGCDNVAVDENVDLKRMRELAEQFRKSFSGNLGLATPLLNGTEDECVTEALEEVEIGGNTGYILSPGCDIPYNVPKENLIAIGEALHDKYLPKTGRSHAECKKTNTRQPSIASKKTEEKLFIDIITIDSKVCPPCQYAVEAVKYATKGLESWVKIRERKIKTEEGRAFAKEFGIKSIPTICINGEPVFRSMIPDIKTIRNEIEKRLGARD
ncbi:MAG: uroporphyrinogen decarboxylase [Candidatus Neomarinimicrobiota bacterium]|nr:MAG: uroporphyrinogen decarboxylase [Candidatus Neomarinimicrobiota bacterium]